MPNSNGEKSNKSLSSFLKVAEKWLVAIITVVLIPICAYLVGHYVEHLEHERQLNELRLWQDHHLQEVDILQNKRLSSLESRVPLEIPPAWFKAEVDTLKAAVAKVDQRVRGIELELVEVKTELRSLQKLPRFSDEDHR